MEIFVFFILIIGVGFLFVDNSKMHERIDRLERDHYHSRLFYDALMARMEELNLRAIEIRDAADRIRSDGK
jgi:predicted nuclease of restriction endonuclease-like (RecB) superfamily